ncbi:MAG TPA: endonuclease/exonuclease/phosphatase family protein [Longimicrobiales bacterium]
MSGCRTGINYLEPDGPRFAGTGVASAAAAAGDTLHVVTFNIAFAEHVDRAIELLTTDPELRGADIVLLQEMDADGTRRIADALGLHWVYYPAIHSLRTRRDFGNAVLSRWPIVADWKLILPHYSRATGTQRIATVAALNLGGAMTLVYSIHLASAAEGGSDMRADQLDAVLEDAGDHPRVIIGGDLNDEELGEIAVARGWSWPTRHGRRTTSIGRWDHVLTRGFATTAHGTVLLVRGASDHRPVWVRLVAVAEAVVPQ